MMPKLEIAIALTSVTPLSVGAGGSAGSLADKFATQGQATSRRRAPAHGGGPAGAD